MSERNKLSNGRFTHDLDSWTISGAEYSAGDGDDHYGVAVLASGEYIEQTFTVHRIREYTFHVDVKPSGADITAGEVQMIITDGDGNTVATINLSGSNGEWTENKNVIGLASGTTYTLKVVNDSFSGDVKIDDVWIWDIAITRNELATRAEDRLGKLATEQSYSTSESGSKTEGDYTFAIDEALRTVDALNPYTADPDIRYLDHEDVSVALDHVFENMLEKLRSDFAVEHDISAGPIKQSRSQIASSIGSMKGGKGGSASRKPVVKKLKYD